MLGRMLHQSVSWLLLGFLALLGLLLLARVPAALLLIFWLAAYWLSIKLSIRFFPVVLFLGSFMVRLIYALCVQTPPDSDFAQLYNASVMFSQGDYSFQSLPYFKEWAYQTGFVVYQGSIISLFGNQNGVLILKIFNCFWNAGINLVIYLLARNLSSEKAARFISLLYAGFVFPITFVSVLTNQHVSAFFIVLGLFILLDKQLLRLSLIARSLASGFLLAVGNILRPDGWIILGSIVVYFFYSLTQLPEWPKMRWQLIRVTLLLIVFFSVNALAATLIKIAGINQEGLTNNNPLWKFVVGLNPESRGGYSEKDIGLVYGKEMPEMDKLNLERDLIRQRVGISALKFGALFIDKLQMLWCDPALDWSYGHIAGDKLLEILGHRIPFRNVDNILQDLQGMMLYGILAACFFGVLNFRRKTDETAVLYSTILVLSFLIYLFIEVQPRYAYLQQIFLFLLASRGMEALTIRFPSLR